MKDTHEAIRARRSIKEFDTEHIMSNEEVETLISLAMLSPTAFNIQHWRFVIVHDKTLRNEIKEVSWGQSQITDSSLFIVLCADLKAWEKEPVRYWTNAGKEVQDYVLPAIEGYYKNKEQVQRDEAMRSCGIVAQTLMLASKAMEYESCPMDGFDFEAVAKLINLPDDHVISMFVAIGKGIKEAWERPGQLEIEDVLIDNSFI